jgi:hypothetical protein
VFDKLHGKMEKCTCQGHRIFMDKYLGECPVRKTQSRPKDSIKVPFRKVGAGNGRQLHVRMWWCSSGLRILGFVLAPLDIPIWVLRDLSNSAYSLAWKYYFKRFCYNCFANTLLVSTHVCQKGSHKYFRFILLTLFMPLLTFHTAAAVDYLSGSYSSSH